MVHRNPAASGAWLSTAHALRATTRHGPTVHSAPSPNGRLWMDAGGNCGPLCTLRQAACGGGGRGAGRDVLEGGEGGSEEGGGGLAGTPLLPESPYGPRRRRSKSF